MGKVQQKNIAIAVPETKLLLGQKPCVTYNHYPVVHSAAGRPQHPAITNCPPKSVNANLDNAFQTVKGRSQIP